MKILILPGLLFLTITGYSQGYYIDSKSDSSFNFVLESECKNVMDYNGITQGISERFYTDDKLILELTIIKNCGQKTILHVTSFIDSIVVTRTDTGQMATCECFQKCTLNVANVVNPIPFNMFGKNEYLMNPFYNDIYTNSLDPEINILYYNKTITIVGEFNEPIRLRLINQIGQEVLIKRINGNFVELPPYLQGLFICEIIGTKKWISKKIYIN